MLADAPMMVMAIVVAVVSTAGAIVTKSFHLFIETTHLTIADFLAFGDKITIKGALHPDFKTFHLNEFHFEHHSCKKKVNLVNTVIKDATTSSFHCSW